MFNSSKKESHHPNAGFKKLFRRLRTHFKISTNKDEITNEVLENADIMVFGGPREAFDDNETEEVKKWLENGGRAMFFFQDGGEKAAGSNCSAILKVSAP